MLIEDTDADCRTLAIMQQQGCKTVQDVREWYCARSIGDMLAIPNLGLKTLKGIRRMVGMEGEYPIEHNAKLQERE